MKLTACRGLSLGFLSEIRLSPRHEQPVVEIEHDRGMILAIGTLAGPRVAGAVLGGNATHAQRAKVGTAGQRRFVEHFGPGIDRVAAEGRPDMPASADS